MQSNAAAQFAAIAMAQAPSGGKPNVVVIYCDDMGWGDPVCFGGGNHRNSRAALLGRRADSALRDFFAR